MHGCDSRRRTADILVNSLFLYVFKQAFDAFDAFWFDAFSVTWLFMGNGRCLQKWRHLILFTLMLRIFK